MRTNNVVGNSCIKEDAQVFRFELNESREIKKTFKTNKLSTSDNAKAVGGI